MSGVLLIFHLLGLMIAFTYSFTVSHYETRKRDVIDEANALGTAAQFLFCKRGDQVWGGLVEFMLR